LRETHPFHQRLWSLAIQQCPHTAQRQVEQAKANFTFIRHFRLTEVGRVQGRRNAKIFPALKKPQRNRQRGDKRGQRLPGRLFNLCQGKFDFCAMGFGGGGESLSPQHRAILIVLATEIQHQLLRRGVQNFANELVAGPAYADRNIVL
jgi:hypothetical protein